MIDLQIDISKTTTTKYPAVDYGKEKAKLGLTGRRSYTFMTTSVFWRLSVERCPETFLELFLDDIVTILRVLGCRLFYDKV